MKALKVQVRKTPEVVDIDTSLKTMQSAVGGLIEIWCPYPDPVVIICNEEGKLIPLEANRYVYDEFDDTIDCIFGDFLIVGVNQDDGSEEDYCDLTDAQIEKFKRIFSREECYA
jgi:hypothetical protein